MRATRGFSLWSRRYRAADHVLWVGRVSAETAAVPCGGNKPDVGGMASKLSNHTCIHHQSLLWRCRSRGGNRHGFSAALLNRVHGHHALLPGMEESRILRLKSLCDVVELGMS